MSHLLYYPHYTPSNLHLKSILLFYDTIDLMVPHVDRPGVMEREHLSPLLQHDERIARFHDPQDYSSWGMDSESLRLLKSVIVKLQNKQFQKTSFHGSSAHYLSRDATQYLMALGWQPIAAQKLPGRVFDLITDELLGGRMGVYTNPNTGRMVEQDAFLTHPELADFILSRLANEISQRQRVHSLTFTAGSYLAHTFQKENRLGIGQRRIDVLRTSIPLIIPDALDSLDINDFLSIRRDFEELRMKLPTHLNEMVTHYELDSPTDAESYYDRLAEVSASISKDIDRALLTIGKQRFKKRTVFAVETVSTVVGTLVGTHLATPEAAVGGALIGLLGGKIANKLMLDAGAGSTTGVSEFARLKGEIAKGHRLRKWSHYFPT